MLLVGDELVDEGAVDEADCLWTRLMRMMLCPKRCLSTYTCKELRGHQCSMELKMGVCSWREDSRRSMSTSFKIETIRQSLRAMLVSFEKASKENDQNCMRIEIEKLPLQLSETPTPTAATEKRGQKMS